MPDFTKISPAFRAVPPDFGAAELKAWRHRLGWTQVTAAGVLGMSRATYHRWEKGLGAVPQHAYYACAYLEEQVTRFKMPGVKKYLATRVAETMIGEVL